MEKDAWVGPSELANFGARGKSSALEEGAGALHEPVNVEVEMPEERPLAVGALPEQEGTTVEPPSTLAETGPKPFPRLEVEGAAAPPLTFSDPAGSSGTSAGP